MLRRLSLRFSLGLAILAAATVVSACETDVRPASPGSAPASSSITLTRDNNQLLIASEDHNAVLVVDRETKRLTDRINVGRGPSHIIVLRDGRAVVSSRYDDSISVIDVNTKQVIQTIDVGSEPIGLTQIDDDASGTRIAVALAGDAAVGVISVDEGRLLRTVTLPALDPRAIAHMGRGRLVVSHMAAGGLSEVNVDEVLANGSIGRVNFIPMTSHNDFGPQTEPEHLRTLTLSLDRQRVLTAHSQANTSVVRAPLNDVDETGSATSFCGYSGCATELGAITPAITEVEVDTGTVLVPAPASFDGSSSANRDFASPPVADCFDCDFAVPSPTGAPNPPSFLNPNEGRFAGIPLNNPVAVALVDGGRGQLMINMGTHNAVLLNRQMNGLASDVRGVANLGQGASGLALSADGSFAYVWNQFDGSVTEIAIPSLDGEITSRFSANSNTVVATVDSNGNEVNAVPQLQSNTFVVVEDVLSPDVSLGRKLFHDATDGRIAQNNAVSCATCHPDGRSDGRTWQFSFGPRNTPQLGGGILDTEPFHWPGDVTHVENLNEMTVQAFMGGSGLDTNTFAKVAAFIDTIPAAPSPTVLRPMRPTLSGTFTDAAARLASVQRGKALFESTATGCTTCHSGSDYTDNISWDIGTRANDVDISKFQTPVLHGLLRTAPYLHDGSMKTVEELLERVVRTDQMGKGSHLTDAEMADLAAFLKSL